MSGREPLGSTGAVAPQYATALRVGAYLWAAVLLANLPGRTALAHHEAQFGLDPAACAIVGLAVDTVDFFGAFVLLNVVVAAVVRLSFVRRRPPFSRALRWTLVPVTTSLVLSVMLGSVWASEHRIERGLYPTMLEFVHSADTGFALAGAQVFALSRFSYVTVASLSLFVGLSWWVLRRSRGLPEVGGAKLFGAVVAGALLVSLACFGCHRASPLVVTSIPNWRVVESPLHVFLSFGVERENVRLGAISLFQRMSLPPSDLGEGTALLGFPSGSAERFSEAGEPTSCHPHPAAEPLAPPPPSFPPHGQAYHHELHRSLDALSRALFEGREGPVRVWLLALESLRADDIHALHARAHPKVAPFTSSLYERARRGEPGVIVAEHMMQAGGRTSQGLAAMTCGMGTMPYGLSAARDLGLLPLRCLPDVLADASFRTAFYYGSNPGFDNMLAFLKYHGFERVKAEKDYVEQIPHEGWSVPDAIVFAQAFEESEREPASQSQLNFAMSLTNHFPFKRPEDFPAAVGERVAEAVEGRGVRPDDVSRLETLSYTDWAFEQLVARIENEAVAKNTVIVAAADHSTTDYFLWREDESGSGGRDRALTQIPFVVVLPDALLDGAADPVRARELAREVNERLASTPISQNDIPRFVLSLLLHSEPVASLPPSWRWHTLGGQRLSPGFRVPNHPEAVAVGLDGAFRVCVASSDGAFKRTDESSKLTLDLEEAVRDGQTLRPAAAVFASLLQGYAKRCWDAEAIRRKRSDQR